MNPVRSGHVYLGCSGWAYPSWKPDFYPAKLSSKKLLEYYATRLNSVEVNYTFRSLPSETTVQTWLAAVDKDFRFSFKAPQRITHMLRLKNCDEPLATFAKAIVPVMETGHMGVVLFQLPPNMKADVECLSVFLDAASSMQLRMAFEFRHVSWLEDATYDVLRKHGAALCVAESDELATPDVLTAPFSCYRLRKSEYSDSELAALGKLFSARAQTGDVFAYFKHEDAPTGALRASTVLEGLRNR